MGLTSDLLQKAAVLKSIGGKCTFEGCKQHWPVTLADVQVGQKQPAENSFANVHARDSVRAAADKLIASQDVVDGLGLKAPEGEQLDGCLNC